MFVDEGTVAKILVIDDEPGIRDLLDTLLTRKGFDVVLADSGQKGLEIYRRTEADVNCARSENAGDGWAHGPTARP